MDSWNHSLELDIKLFSCHTPIIYNIEIKHVKLLNPWTEDTNLRKRTGKEKSQQGIRKGKKTISSFITTGRLLGEEQFYDIKNGGA